MESASQQFKQGLTNAYSTKIGKSASPSGMMRDMAKYSSEMKETNKLKGGLADNKSLVDLAKKHAYDDSKDSTSKDRINKMLSHLKSQFEKGLKVEKEHTRDVSKAKEIVMDHLSEDPNYYVKLKKIEKQETDEATSSGSSGAFEGPLFGGETDFAKKSNSETPKLDEGIAVGAMGLDKVEAKEATGSGSVGGYSSPAMWAKSTSKKDWGPSRKTQIPGGGFVKVKKKCTKFPYCNQGDINALKITKNESVKEAIKNVAKTMGVSENVIKTILEHEYEKNQKRNK
jgi:hypothetical protein